MITTSLEAGNCMCPVSVSYMKSVNKGKKKGKLMLFLFKLDEGAFNTIEDIILGKQQCTR